MDTDTTGPSTVAPAALLVHGAATTGRVWRFVLPHLHAWSATAPDRPASGDLDTELGSLAPLAGTAVVGGVSGGATLGLAMAMAGIPMRAAVLHEPAVGSLSPKLLDGVVAAWESGGVEGFGAALYGPAWTRSEAPADPNCVARDLAMFRAFEPSALPVGHPPVLLTVGENSPAIRHGSVSMLADVLGVPYVVIPGAGHAVHLEEPAAFAALILAHLEAKP